MFGPLVLVLATAGAPAGVGADAPNENKDAGEEKRPRNEVAAFPIVAGSSDIGVQVGAVGALTRVAPDIKPYVWKTDVLLSVSFKGGPRGYELVQHHHGLRWDVPTVRGTPWRIEPGLFVERTVNAGYFGVGNAVPAIPIDESGRFGSKYQYVHFETRARLNVRYPLNGKMPPPGERGGPWWIRLGAQLRYVNPRAYEGSQLEADGAIENPDGSKYIFGVRPLWMPIPSIGILYDTRDDEITPTRGANDSLSIRGSVAFPTSERARYLGVTLLVQRYFPIVGPLVLATRFFGDFLTGNVPFYDLSQGGAFIPMEMLGGPQGVRGVPNGRYNTPIKMVANVELRAMLLPFSLLKQHFKLGLVTFADVGRGFARWGSDPRDGKGLGLKYGVGGGIYVQWGEAALFRIEVAYSPDAPSANPGVPVGIYASDGQMF